ncbi:MAG TPA: ABC transporter ATP-binding protein, partial [Thermomicrobiales bacterium]|nr:ABC transporter ATP-binding protein [Thermomicrobiales bacterium]
MPPPNRPRDRARDAATMRRVAGTFRPYRWRVYFIFFLTILATVLGLVNPLLTEKLFDDAIGGKDLHLLVEIVSIMAITPIISAVITVWQTYLNAIVGQHVMQDLRNRLYAHLQRMPLQFFTSTRTGEIQSRLANDVAGIENVLSDTFVQTVRNLSMAISTVIAMFVLSIPLTLISLALVPVIYILSVRVGRMGREINANRQERLASLTAMMEETLSVSGAMLIKVFGRSRQAQERFTTENQRLADLSIQRQMIGVGLMASSMTLFSLAPVLIYLIAGWQLIDSTNPPLSIGTIIAFTSLQSRLIGGWGPVTQLLNLPVQLQTSLAYFDRIFEYLDLPVSIKERPNAEVLPRGSVRGEVRFDDVWFAYQ